MAAATYYKVTIDGGATLVSGIMSRCAIEALPTLRKGRRIYVRCTTAGGGHCVMFHQPNDGPLVVEPTLWGQPCPSPDWAGQFASLFTTI